MIRSSASAGLRDHVDALLLIAVERGFLQQTRHADDAVHRRADLMAHRRQEPALGAGGGERLVARLGQRLALLVEACALAGVGQGLAAQQHAPSSRTRRRASSAMPKWNTSRIKVM